jgi:hypothetical protein
VFALIVTGRERRADLPDKPVVGPEGQRYWVLEDRDGWVEASSSRCNNPAVVPGDVRQFKTEEAAAAFAKRWTGHPWWCSPNGEFEIVKVRPKYRQVLVGWERVCNAPDSTTAAAPTS